MTEHSTALTPASGEKVTLAEMIEESERTVREAMQTAEQQAQRGRWSMPIDLSDVTVLCALAAQAIETIRLQGENVALPTPHFGTAVYAEISAERERAHAKHGRNSMESKPAGAFIRYTILAEEVGEIAKEFNEAEVRGGQHTLDLARLYAECIQVAAMASAWADRLAFVMSSLPPAPQEADRD